MNKRERTSTILLEERLKRKLIPNGECLEWAGCRGPKGYGVINLVQPRKTMQTHRVAYILAKGEIPNGLQVRHTCDNPPCCNPNHLILGTPKENTADILERNPSAVRKWSEGGSDLARRFRGERHGGAILTERDVIQMRKMRMKGCAQRVIAEKFGVSEKLVWKILRLKLWAHVHVPGYEYERAWVRDPERPTNASLTPENVREIRRLIADGNLTKSAIASKFGVSKSTIGDIAHGRIWRNLT